MGGETDKTTVRVTVEDPAQPYCVALVEALWHEMGKLYGDEGPCRFMPRDFSNAGCAFVVAWLGDEAIGSGAIRPFEGTECEVKRIYVAPEARNRGVARAIMLEIEKRARELGYRSLRLETGTLQPYAIRLYQNLGYEQIEAYGQYKHDPRSVCFAKSLGE